LTDFELPPLRPDIRFQRLPDTEEALDFSFAAKKAALGPHIIARWPWDESYQRSVHRLRFEKKPFFSILREAKLKRAGFARASGSYSVYTQNS